MDKVFRVYGKVVKVSGVYLEATVPEDAVGNQCIIKTEMGGNRRRGYRLS
ncbi:MAG: hypothetical protein ACO2PP_06100 [Thermocrinis sp.]|jgi:flagellum-specific ATP synthase